MTDEHKPPLRLAVVQFDAVCGDVERNIASHIGLLEEAAAAGAALTIFPELSLTGYCAGLLDQDVSALAIDPQGDRIADLRGACTRLNIMAVVGAPVMAGDGCHLAAIVIDRAGGIDRVYRKMYLDEEERRWFVRGGQPEQISLDGWKLGIGICYDSSFPEHARSYALAGADAYLLSGAFPKGRSDYRRTIYFPARSLENTMYLAFSNYVGEHGGLAYGGMSAIHGPDGQCLSDAGPADAGIATFDLDHEHLQETRRSLQMLRDR